MLEKPHKKISNSRKQCFHICRQDISRGRLKVRGQDDNNNLWKQRLVRCPGMGRGKGRGGLEGRWEVGEGPAKKVTSRWRGAEQQFYHSLKPNNSKSSCPIPSLSFLPLPRQPLPTFGSLGGWSAYLHLSKQYTSNATS